MEPAFITAIVSILLSILALVRFYITESRLKTEFKKNQQRQVTQKLIDLRLEYYPKAFEITDGIVKRKGNKLNVKELKIVKSDINKWRTGITRLIISNKSYGILLDLHDALTKQPAHGEDYSDEQVHKIWQYRNDFRRSLRKDIGLLHEEDENNGIQQ